MSLCLSPSLSHWSRSLPPVRSCCCFYSLCSPRPLQFHELLLLLNVIRMEICADGRLLRNFIETHLASKWIFHLKPIEVKAYSILAPARPCLLSEKATQGFTFIYIPFLLWSTNKNNHKNFQLGRDAPFIPEMEFRFELIVSESLRNWAAFWDSFGYFVGLNRAFNAMVSLKFMRNATPIVVYVHSSYLFVRGFRVGQKAAPQCFVWQPITSCRSIKLFADERERRNENACELFVTETIKITIDFSASESW